SSSRGWSRFATERGTRCEGCHSSGSPKPRRRRRGNGRSRGWISKRSGRRRPRAEAGNRGLDRLWAPWRIEYIEAPHPLDEGCVFCDKLALGDDEQALILARAGRAFAMLNAYPYNPGHLMIAPLRHIGGLEDLDAAELADVDGLLQRSLGALKKASVPDGFNVGLNLGRVAGAGVLGHVHWH